MILGIIFYVLMGLLFCRVLKFSPAYEPGPFWLTLIAWPLVFVLVVIFTVADFIDYMIE